MKRRAWVAVAAVVVVLLLIGLFIGIHVAWLHSGPPEERRSIIWPSGGESASSHAVTVKVAPELTGVTALHIGGGEEVETHLFLRIEKAIAHFKLTTGEAPLNNSDLVYELYDADGNWIGSGSFPLDGPVPAKSSREVEIRDARLQEAWSMLIRPRPNPK
jgi:hypothetical protein